MDFDKLHILLVCNLGASTSVMVSKMKEVAEKSEKLKGIDMKIDAYPVGSLKEHVEKYDVILAGPQIKHKEKEIREGLRPLLFSHRPVDHFLVVYNATEVVVKWCDTFQHQ